MGARTPTARMSLSNAGRIALRAEAIQSIQALLVVAPATTETIAQHLGVPRPTAYNYMRQMEQDGQARRTGRFEDRSELWEAGARVVDTRKDTPARQGESLRVLEQVLARPARGAAA